MEFLAARTHLKGVHSDRHPRTGTEYDVGYFNCAGGLWKVALVETGKGNVNAAIAAERAITHFRPQVVMFVGVAGGIKDVTIGDVVAADIVYGYESGKVAKTFCVRPSVGQSTHRIVQVAKAEAKRKAWHLRLPKLLSGRPHRKRKPRALVQPIAAGEKVLASVRSELYSFLRNNYNDAHAVEMEGRGFLAATHAYSVESLVIRGISDLLAKKAAAEKGGSQEWASATASAFAFQVLACLRPPLKPSMIDQAVVTIDPHNFKLSFPRKVFKQSL